MRRRGREEGEGERGEEGERAWTSMMEGETVVGTHINDEDCCSSFQCHLVVFKCGQLSSYMGAHFCMCVVVFMYRQPFWCVGSCSKHGWSFACVSSWLHAWVVVGVSGIVVAHGVMSCDSAG